jgi:5'-3' exonuclease
MGIPCFYSYIVKNHGSIIKTLKNVPCDNLYIDGNSIIYDSYNDLEPSENFEDELIQQIIMRLNALINKVHPRSRCYIAFDGVAPLAKMKQQRVRRFKSEYERDIRSGLGLSNPTKWNTNAITPGTLFMKKLSDNLKDYYIESSHIVVSSSEQPGEGEHKIFALVRNNIDYHLKTITCIYGLDADLIMLSLNHSQNCDHIVLYRETPQFIKQIDSSLDPAKDYVLDIKHLGKAIGDDFGDVGRISDYVFMCFILGNDFIPHTPSINIRTNGINVLMAVYNDIIVRQKRYLIRDGTIHWGNFKLFIEGLKQDELSRIKEEYSKRRNYKLNKTSLDDKVLFLPLLDKREEQMINPYESFWQDRYYNHLNDIDRNNDNVLKTLCINYLEGLEWTMCYYTHGCNNWYWKYNYLYAPLLSDLYRFIPSFNITLVSNNIKLPVSPYTQLAYVLPRSSHHLIPEKIRTYLDTNYRHYYDSGVIKWAFFKYFWESVVQFDQLNIEQFNIEINNKII